MRVLTGSFKTTLVNNKAVSKAQHIDILEQTILCCRDRPVHCRMFSRIPRLTHEMPAAVPQL